MRQHRRLSNTLFWTFGISAFVLYLTASSLLGPRVGAICEDGWRSHSTGRGTCSHHGGVDYWLHQDPHPKLRKNLTWIAHGSILSALLSLTMFSRGGVTESGQSLPLSDSPKRNTDTQLQELCERCGAPMKIRKRRKDGHRFLGCSRFPRCRNARDL
jgi:hypothetical protein